MKVLICIQLLVCTQQIAGTRRAITPPPGSHDNPNFIRDRSNYEIEKPDMPFSWYNRYTPPFDPQWMDYCDPYHCKYYDKNACGLNRSNMKFKLFQSTCHLIMNNKCAVFRGFLKYDIIDIKFCQYYKITLRGGCPVREECASHTRDPLCAINSIDGHVVLFENQCYMDAVNCNNTVDKYDEIYMTFCEKGLNLKLDSKEKHEKEIKLDEK